MFVRSGLPFCFNFGTWIHYLLHYFVQQYFHMDLDIDFCVFHTLRGRMLVWQNLENWWRLREIGELMPFRKYILRIIHCYIFGTMLRSHCFCVERSIWYGLGPLGHQLSMLFRHWSKDDLRDCIFSFLVPKWTPKWGQGRENLRHSALTERPQNTCATQPWFYIAFGTESVIHFLVFYSSCQPSCNCLRHQPRRFLQRRCLPSLHQT